MLVPVLDVCGSLGCLGDTSAAFQRKLVQVARDIGVDPSDLATVMAFETGGSFASDQLNTWCEQARGKDPGRCGTGLIQFMPPTTRAMAQKAGVELDNYQLATMSNVRQLDWVRYYFKGLNRGSYHGLGDLYRTVFWPAARGKASSYVATREGEAAYTQNRALDRSGKGYITAADIDYPVTVLKAAASKRAPLMVNTVYFPVIPVLVGLTAGAGLAYVLTRHPERVQQMSQKLTGLIHRG